MDGTGREKPTLLEWVLDVVKGAGASAAEVMLAEGEALAAGVRLGNVEKLKSSSESRLGLRVFSGQASASASTAEFGRAELAKFAAETVALAKVTGADPWSGLPEPGLHPQHPMELDLVDREHGLVAAERALEMARRAEKAALDADARIKNSEGAEFESSRATVWFANSQGFFGEYSTTSYGLSVAPIADSGEGMQQGYWYTAGRKFEKLQEPEAVGIKAAHRALRRLGARKIDTCRAPVVFDPETAASLLRTLAAAASGPALYKGASYLVGRLGEQVAGPAVNVIDDPTMVSGLGSRPFDGEGVAVRRKYLVEKGKLATYLLDSYSARKLKLQTTGNAARSLGSAPDVSPFNLCLEPGRYDPEQIIRSVGRGLLVTEMIGFGINLATGDYSRGASGVWIEGGELAYPVHEITIAGNLKDMLLAIEMVGNDLEWRSSTACPTVKIGEVTIGGN